MSCFIICYHLAFYRIIFFYHVLLYVLYFRVFFFVWLFICFVIETCCVVSLLLIASLLGLHDCSFSPQTTPHFRVHQMFINHMQEPKEEDLLDEIHKHHYLRTYVNYRPMRVLDDWMHPEKTIEVPYIVHNWTFLTLSGLLESETIGLQSQKITQRRFLEMKLLV